MWKDYFYFTKSERRGVVVLLVIIGVLIVARIVLPHFTQPQEETTPLTKQDVERLHQLEQQMSQLTEGEIPSGKIDPCQLDSSGFVKVGFTADQAHELINIKRSCEQEEFPALFLDYAVAVDEEWIDHVKL